MKEINRIWKSHVGKIRILHAFSHTKIRCEINQGNDEADRLAEKGL